MAVPMASVGNGVVNGTAGGLPGGGEVFWQGNGPWIAFLLAKEGVSLPQQTDRPSAEDRVRALDSSWETADQTQDKEEA